MEYGSFKKTRLRGLTFGTETQKFNLFEKKEKMWLYVKTVLCLQSDSRFTIILKMDSFCQHNSVKKIIRLNA